MIPVKRTVMLFGTFDIFHKGHISFLKQAKKHGDYLIVVVARDINVQKIKGKLPRNNEQKRAKAIRQSQLADKVVLGQRNNRYHVIKKYKPAVICLGYDQQVDRAELRKNILDFGLKNVKIKKLRAYKPDIYKSSKLQVNTLS